MNRALVGMLLVTVVIAGCTGGSGDGDTPDTDGSDAPTSSDNTDSGGDTSANEDNGGTAAAGENVVQYSSSGFSPETIRIEQGETVTWVSDGPQMWVATDQHPMHTQYDGTSTAQHCSGSTDTFDQCETGGEYRFTFDKSGEWAYHNHEAPSHTGTVIVE